MRTILASCAAVILGFGCAAPTTTESLELTTSNIEPATDDGDEDVPAIAGDDSEPSLAPSLAGVTEVRATTNVNLRDEDHEIILVVSKGAILTLLAPEPVNGFYRVSLNGIDGYCSARYLEVMGTASGPTLADVDGPPSPENALARAQAAMGFSYFWGGGAWLESGPTVSNRGSCSGSCPSCTHSGSYGADCSGLVAKAWQFGTLDLATNSHPYGTVHFVNDVAGKWTTIPRDTMKTGDALVYNTNGSGHIVLYEKGDGWGTPVVLECKGCAAGCVRSARTFGAAYHAIRRAGF